jgi:hypothetical protein
MAEAPQPDLPQRGSDGVPAQFAVGKTPLPAVPPGEPVSTGPPPSRLVVYCVIALLLVTGAIIGLGTQVESLVLDRVRGAAAQRGLLIDWDEASVSPSLGVDLRGVRVRGADVEASAESIVAELSWSTLASGEPTVETVLVTGLDGTVDLRTGAGSSQSSGSSVRASALGVVRANGRLLVRAAGKREVELDRLSFFGKPGNNAWHATIVADCARGCGPEPMRVDASVLRSGGRWQASAQLERPMDLTELITADGAGLAPSGLENLRDVKARHFELAYVQGEPRVAARHLQGALAVAGWEGTFEVDRASVGSNGNVHLRRPRIAVGRRAGGGKEHVATNRWRGLLTDPHAATQVVHKLTRLLERVEVDGGSVAVEGVATLDDVDASARNGNAVATGRIGGGTVRFFFGAEDDEIRIETQGVRFGGLARRWRPAADAAVEGTVSGMLTVRPTLMVPPPVKSLTGRTRPVSAAHAWRARGALKFEGVGAKLPKVAQAPFSDVDAKVGFEAFYVPAEAPGEEDRLVVRTADATLAEGVVVRFKGEARNVLQPAAAPMVIALDADVDDVDCGVALRALPAAALPHLRDHLRARGRFAPGLSLHVDLEKPYDSDVQVRGLPGTCQLTALGPFSPDVLNDETYRKEVTEGTSRAGIFVGPGSERYVPIGSIPRHVAASAYLSEEILFNSNPGFAMGLMRKALRLNLDKGRYVYGGSSVSQQLVKNLFLTRRKTLVRKLEEALIVWRMESVVSKRRILELYLNCIEFGPDLYGFGRASWFYFGKPVSKLTPLEGAFLAALKPAPWLGARYKRRGATPDKGWWPKRLESLMDRLVERGHITRDEYAAAAPFVVDSFK